MESETTCKSSELYSELFKSSIQRSNQPSSLLCLRKSPRLSWKPKTMQQRNNDLAAIEVWGLKNTKRSESNN